MARPPAACPRSTACGCDGGGRASSTSAAARGFSASRRRRSGRCRSWEPTTIRWRSGPRWRTHGSTAWADDSGSRQHRLRQSAPSRPIRPRAREHPGESAGTAGTADGGAPGARRTSRPGWSAGEPGAAGIPGLSPPGARPRSAIPPERVDDAGAEKKTAAGGPAAVGRNWRSDAQTERDSMLAAELARARPRRLPEASAIAGMSAWRTPMSASRRSSSELSSPNVAALTPQDSTWRATFLRPSPSEKRLSPSSSPRNAPTTSARSCRAWRRAPQVSVRRLLTLTDRPRISVS